MSHSSILKITKPSSTYYSHFDPKTIYVPWGKSLLCTVEIETPPPLTVIFASPALKTNTDNGRLPLPGFAVQHFQAGQATFEASENSNDSGQPITYYLDYAVNAFNQEPDLASNLLNVIYCFQQTATIGVTISGSDGNYTVAVDTTSIPLAFEETLLLTLSLTDNTSKGKAKFPDNPQQAFVWLGQAPNMALERIDDNTVQLTETDLNADGESYAFNVGVESGGEIVISSSQVSLNSSS